ncbi:MAG TPA: LytTR family DNA-binding domain-containing protein [Steroidobacteraceae bacterium]|nr:LytTR family DNA-binding domain-containing protein [Steroidobacteraceae bacterium]
MPISALIADDEAAARSRLRRLLAPHSFELIEGDAADGVATLEAIRRHRPQVVFLDVQMPGLDGFEVVESLSADEMPLIVFVTAYDAYALAAFEANAVAYLLKPVMEDRLRTVVARLEQLVRSPSEAARETAKSSAAAGAERRPLRHLLALQREGYLLIPLAEVCYFQVEDGVTHVKTAGASYRTHYAIGDLEARLPAPPFVRAHRSTVVNLDQVASVSPLFKGSLLLKIKDAQGSEIQVSERQAKHVREMLQM